jgi:2-hydroxy-6-oxo-6-(2'-aminophenyl)hexa-2,4-dienoate hydrolase
VTEWEQKLVSVRRTSRFIDAGGIKTHYIQCGTSGPALVLVHGGGAGADAIGNWAGVMAAFGDRFRVFAVDMVGFGQSDKPDVATFGYSQTDRETHLAAFVSALNVGPVTLVGNSMGGLTSLGVTRDYPQLVANLVLMGSAGIPIPMSPELQSIMQYDFTIAGMQRIVDALTGPNFKAPEGLVDYRYRLSIEPGTRAAYGAIVGWMKARGGLHIEDSQISAVKARTLVVGGKDDNVVPISCVYRFLELIDDSTGYIMPHCGHWPMIEYPDAFAAVVEMFVSQGAR